MDPKFLTRVVASLLLSQVAFAGLPPTSTRVSGDTSDITTFVFRFPNFTGTHTGTIMSLGVNSIAGGGTGQTTALGARLALLPSLTGHAGEVLTVNPGETDLVYTPAGSGTVTSVDVIDSTGVLSPTGGPITTSGSIDLPFTHVGGSVAFLSPLGGSIGAPLFRLIDLSDLPTIPPNKITGADPFTFAGYNSAGTLDLVPGWSFENGSSALRAYNAKDVTALGGFTFTNLDAASEQTADSTQNIYSFNLDSHFDRNHTDTNLAGVYTGLNMSHRSEGAGSIDTLIGANLQTQLGNGTGGHANQMTGALIGLNPSLNTTVDYAQGLNVSINGDPTSLVTHGDGIFVGNYTKFSENFNLLSLFNQNTGTIGGDYRAVAMSNNADVGGFSANTIGFDTNNITKGATGFGYFHTGNVGDGSGVGFNLVDGNQNNGTVDASGNIFNFNTNSVWNQGFNGLNLNLGGGSAEFKGDVNMVNLFNNAILTGNNTLRAMAFTNNSDGYRVVAGISAFTSGNMSEEIRGSLYNLAGNSRTKTGIDLSLTGAATDDATGLRVNVNNQTSSTQHVHSGTFEGGLFSVQGDFTPFNGAAVEIGNGFSMGSTIQSGSPLTGHRSNHPTHPKQPHCARRHSHGAFRARHEHARDDLTGRSGSRQDRSLAPVTASGHDCPSGLGWDDHRARCARDPWTSKLRWVGIQPDKNGYSGLDLARSKLLRRRRGCDRLLVDARQRRERRDIAPKTCDRHGITEGRGLYGKARAERRARQVQPDHSPSGYAKCERRNWGDLCLGHRLDRPDRRRDPGYRRAPLRTRGAVQHRVQRGIHWTGPLPADASERHGRPWIAERSHEPGQLCSRVELREPRDNPDHL
jgi:hypothetical protein